MVVLNNTQVGCFEAGQERGDEEATPQSSSPGSTAFLFTLFVFARPLCLILTSLFALNPTKSHSCIFSTYLGYVSRFAKADSDKETKEEQVDDLRKTVEFLIMLPLLLWK